MEITWSYLDRQYRARIEPAVVPYVETIGAEKACQLFLKFGGGEIYFAREPRQRNPTELVKTIGADAVKRIFENPEIDTAGCVPLAMYFCIRFLHNEGVAIQEIARRVRCTTVTVRKVLSHPHLPGARK